MPGGVGKEQIALNDAISVMSEKKKGKRLDPESGSG